MYTTFYCSSSKFSKFIQGNSPLLQQLASVSLLRAKSKICPKLIELLLSSWKGPTVHVCCFMLACASTKTFVSRVRKTAKEIFVSRKIRYQGHSLAEVSLYLCIMYACTIYFYFNLCFISFCFKFLLTIVFHNDRSLSYITYHPFVLPYTDTTIYKVLAYDSVN